MKKDLDSQKAKKAELFKQLEAQQASLKVEKADLEKESDELSKMEHQLEGEIQAEQARLAELARQREIERKRQAEAEAAKACSCTTTSDSKLSSSGIFISISSSCRKSSKRTCKCRSMDSSSTWNNHN